MLAVPADRLPDAIGDLDPGNRALLDLSLRRGVSDAEIGELLRKEPADVAAGATPCSSCWPTPSTWAGTTAASACGRRSPRCRTTPGRSARPRRPGADEPGTSPSRPSSRPGRSTRRAGRGPRPRGRARARRRALLRARGGALPPWRPARPARPAGRGRRPRRSPCCSSGGDDDDDSGGPGRRTAQSPPRTAARSRRGTTENAAPRWWRRGRAAR